jgi:hypothetical protein
LSEAAEAGVTEVTMVSVMAATSVPSTFFTVDDFILASSAVGVGHPGVVTTSIVISLKQQDHCWEARVDALQLCAKSERNWTGVTDNSTISDKNVLFSAPSGLREQAHPLPPHGCSILHGRVPDAPPTLSS